MEIGDVIGLVKGGATAIDAILKSVKTVKEMVQKPKTDGIANVPPVDNRLDEILDQALALKQLQLEVMEMLLTLKNEKFLIEQERSGIEKFNAQAENYILHEVSPHSHAYVPKDGIATGKHARYLCAACFEQKHHSLFQFKQREFNFDTLQCPRCPATIRIPNDVRAEARVAKVRRGWDFFDDM